MMLGKLSRRCYCTSVHQQPWLFLGLGNPGDKYNGTRHNVPTHFLVLKVIKTTWICLRRFSRCLLLFGYYVADWVRDDRCFCWVSGDSDEPAKFQGYNGTRYLCKHVWTNNSVSLMFALRRASNFVLSFCQVSWAISLLSWQSRKLTWTWAVNQ